MGFKDYFFVIARRWHIFLLIVFITISSHMIWAIFSQSKLYHATSMVIISPSIIGPSGLVLIRKPASPISRVKTFRETSMLNIAVQLLTGERPFSSVEFNHPDRQEVIRDLTEKFKKEIANESKRHLLKELENSISVHLDDDRVVTINARSPSNERALAFAWSIAEAARIFHNEYCQEMIEKTVADLKNQLGEEEKQKKNILNEQAEFVKKTGFTNLPRYQEMIQGIIFDIEEEMSQLKAKQQEIERAIDEHLVLSIQGREEIQEFTEAVEKNPRLRELREQLLKVRLDYDIATSRYTERHPAISSLKLKLERLEELIHEEDEVLITEGLKKWSHEIRNLVMESGAIDRKLQVFKERKSSLSQELFRLADISQDYSRIEEQAKNINATIARMQREINELEWRGLQMLGQVQVRNLANQGVLAANPGTGTGSIIFTMVMAVILALCVIFALEYIDTRVKTEQDVQRCLGLPLLEIIPKKKNNLLSADFVEGTIAEKFNTAATLIRSAAQELGMKSFMVTSAVPQEGKTTVSINLASALARKGIRVILVDGDLRIPRIHEFLTLPNKIGLSTVLDAHSDPRQIIDGIVSKNNLNQSHVGVADALVPTEIENLSVLTSGPPADSPIQILEDNRMRRVLGELTRLADFVIIDTPPVNNFADALTIAGLVDGTILVVGSGLCDQNDVEWAKYLLSNVQASLVGVFLNRYSRRIDRRGSFYYYHTDPESKEHTLSRIS